MLMYVLMIEFWECAAPEPCHYAHLCTPEMNHHPRRTMWRPYKSISTNPGPQTTHMSRLLRDFAKYHRQGNSDKTGNMEVFVIDSANTVPLWADEERAAFRIGGMDAVHRVTKAKAAAVKAAERAVQRAAAKDAKDKARMDRPKRKGKVTRSRWSEIPVP